MLSDARHDMRRVPAVGWRWRAGPAAGVNTAVGILARHEEPPPLAGAPSMQHGRRPMSEAYPYNGRLSRWEEIAEGLAIVGV